MLGGDLLFPEWVQKYKGPGTTVKKIGNNYYLYHATSRWNPEKNYPQSVQTYIWKITEEGVVNEKVSIAVGRTEACLLSELIKGLPDNLGNIIVLRVKGEWLYTKTNEKVIKQLMERGLYDNGKVVF